MANNVEITFEIYKWLSSLQIITTNQKYKSSGNVQLDSKIYEQLISGSLMAKIVQKLALDLRVELNGPLLSSIKKSNTPAARLYNWNILNESFSKMDINLSKQMQKQIVSGNFEELKRFLLEIHRKILPKRNQKTNQPKIQASEESQIDFKKIESYETYQQCESMISKNCGITLKQAFSTLAQNLKYLAHMIVKGIKNSYEQIYNFFQCMIENIPHIMYLCEKDPSRNTEFLLEIVKPSLISRDSRVALLGSRTLKAIVYESLKYNEKNLVYQLLSQEHVGFDFIYMGIKRHPHLTKQFNDFLHPLIETTYKQFYEVHLKNIINNEQEYIKTIILLLEGIIQFQSSKKLIIESGLLNIWVKMCESSFNSINNSKGKRQPSNGSSQDAKIYSLQLLCDLWKSYSSEMDELQAEQLLMKGIQELKKNTRKDNYMIKITALCRLFDFLDYLATHKNRLASVVYKKMIFLFVENHEDNQIRQVILQNFSLILKKFSTIPLEFMLEPLLRQLESSEGVTYILNIYDFQFLIEIFKHPKMESANALSFLEYFTKLYSKNIIYSNLVFRIIQLLASRYCEENTITQYVLKNIDANLNVYGMLVLGKKKQYKNYNQSNEDNIMNNQKKSQIIELIKFYVKLQNQIISQSIKEKVLGLYINWTDKKNHQDNGLYSILTLFGDVDQLSMKERISLQTRKHESITESRDKKIAKNMNDTPIKMYNDGEQSRLRQLKNHQDDEPKSRLMYDSFNQQYENEKYLNNEAKYTRPYGQSKKEISADPKTLQDIELYRQKFKKQTQRRKIIQQRQAEPEVIHKASTAELIQRQLSLGYNKLFNQKQITSDNMVFEFDSVKKKHLKEETEIINLEIEEERDLESANLILQKYQKYLKCLFYKYTAFGNIANRSPTQQKAIITFTDLMRMLKQKNLNKIPKVIINQLIIHINRKKKYNSNILAGIEENQFNQFLILFTNLYTKIQLYPKDVPFGYKIEQILIKFLENEMFAKELFDKKSQQWFQQNKISQLTPEEQQYIDPLEDYKKVVSKQVLLKYKINAVEFNISQSYENCTEALNEIFQSALGISIFPPMTESKQIIRIIPLTKVPKPRIPQNLTQKLLKKSYSVQKQLKQQAKNNSELDMIKVVTKQAQTNRLSKKLSQMSNFKISTKVNRSRSHKQIKNKTDIMQEDKQKKKILQAQYAKKLKNQVEFLRKQKSQKQQQQRGKKDQQQRIRLKKQQTNKKYYEQNKKKVIEMKQQEKIQKVEEQGKKKEEKEKQKAVLKQRQKQLLQKQKQKIRLRQQRFGKSQQQQKRQPRRIEKRVDEVRNGAGDERARDKAVGQQVADSGSGLARVVQNFEKEIKILFEEYWNWKTQKIELQAVALLMKNFKVSPEYLAPKIIAEGYKIFAKGQPLNLEQFKQLLAIYSFKAEKGNEEGQKEENQFNTEILQNFLKERLQMKNTNYPQTIKMAKLQKI